MNDYLSKPIDKKTLVAGVEKWLGFKAIQSDSYRGQSENEITSDLIDEQVLSKLIADISDELISDAFLIFKKETEGLLNQIETLAKKGDIKGLQDKFHLLKSTSGTFGGRKLHELTKIAEKACIENELEKVLELSRDMAPLTKDTLDVLSAKLLN
jgi:HPt (histidine-containing phosphotransfer) domain-containing protein